MTPAERPVPTAPPGRPWAIVTGAARGIGAATAIRLARDGFDLVLVDGPAAEVRERVGYPLGTPEQLHDTAAACRVAGGATAHAVAADVRDEGALAEAVRLVPAGGLRAVVAVAGLIGAAGPAWELSRADLDVELATNFHGVANLARLTVPLLLAAPPRTGRFVAVVSTAGVSGLPLLAGYVAAKHAALGFIRALAADLGPSGVTANAVLPGSTRTALLDRSADVYGLPDAEGFAGSQRIGRLVEPAEVADTIGWLCGAGAAAVTGAAVRVDGGFVG